MTRVLVIGLDCLGPEVLDPSSRSFMPHVAGVMADGCGGVLESVLPPITVPAWTCMFTGRDPGELGLYGFRNRTTLSHSRLARATATWVRTPRLWEELDALGRPTITVGMPLTSPVQPMQSGCLVCGFEGPQGGERAWWPGHLDQKFPELADYVFDIDDFREVDADHVVKTGADMTRKRFELFSKMLRSRSWELASLHEIGPDRMHHCFWRDHDPSHPRHEAGSPSANHVVDYYGLLDRLVGELLAEVPDDVAVLLASDHGATAMHGAVCINEILRELGLLVLREEPSEPRRVEPEDVDWQRSRAWACGGYFGRIFFNIQGREATGILAPAEVRALEQRLRDTFANLELGDGRRLHNTVVAPGELYRRVRGAPPDLMVFFEEEHWRAVGTVGLGRRWIEGNDRGIDHANHARNGMYALRLPGAQAQGWRHASILDIFPTLRGLLDLPADPSLQGTDLLGQV